MEDVSQVVKDSLNEKLWQFVTLDIANSLYPVNTMTSPYLIFPPVPPGVFIELHGNIW